MCVVEALDHDQDGFASALCAADPGDDCDDDAAAVNPDATEICDGVDNDCNELADTLDGLPLGGTTSAPIEDLYSLDIAWSPESEAFAVVFDKTSEEGIFFSPLLANGAWVGGATPMFPPADSIDYFWPHIAWGDETFGVVWSSYDSSNGFFVNMTNVTVGGTPSAVRPSIAGVNNDIAARSDGEFVVVNSDSTTLATHVSHFSTGTLHTGPEIATEVLHAHIAAHGNESAIVWHDRADSKVYFRRLDADLSPLGNQATVLDEGGAHAQITTTADGYALAWVGDDGMLGFSRVRADGSPICSRTDVDLDITLDDSEYVVLAETQYGTLTLFGNKSGKLLLHRFGTDCTITAQFTVAQDPSSVGTNYAVSPAIAVGGGLVAIGWGVPSTETGYTRVFGERLCE